MSPKDTILPLSTYLLVEQSNRLYKYATLYKDIVSSILKHYEQKLFISTQLILVPLHPSPVAEEGFTTRCNLGFGFIQVLESVPAELGSPVAVFVLLQNPPGGEWQEPLKKLAAHSNTDIHVLWLADHDPRISLEDQKFMTDTGVFLLGFEEIEKYRDYVAKVILIKTGLVKSGSKVAEVPHANSAKVGTETPEAPPLRGEGTPTESAIIPASEPRSAIQPVTPADEKDPRSLQIVLPPTPAAQPKVTIPISQPLSEPAPAAPTAEGAPSGPPPAAPAPASPEERSDEMEKEPLPAETSAPAAPVEAVRDKPPAEAGEAPTPKVQVDADTRQPAEPEEPVQPPALKPEPEPPVGKDGVASNWKNIEPPAELEDRVDHTAKQLLPTDGNWLLAAASRRGKMHAHQGIFREDAFGLGYAEGWNFVIVADGGGSRSLARVGSKLAAEVGIKAMVEEARNQAKGSSSLDNICSYILQNALRKAYEAIRKEAQNREKKVDDFGTTFLAVAYRPMDEQRLIGTLQVGDGLIAAMFPDRPPMVLADPDVGESASQTLFLTSKPANEWMSRIKVYHLDLEPALVVCMCDGVSDDLIPYKTNLPTLFAVLSDMVRQDEPEQALLEFLNYEKRGSFDDRTLAVIFPKLAGQQSPSTATEGAVDQQPALPSVPEKTENAQVMPVKEEPSRKK